MCRDRRGLGEVLERHRSHLSSNFISFSPRNGPYPIGPDPGIMISFRIGPYTFYRGLNVWFRLGRTSAANKGERK